MCSKAQSLVTGVISCWGGLFQNADKSPPNMMEAGHRGIFSALGEFDPNSFEGSTLIIDFLQSSHDNLWPRYWNWGVWALWQSSKVLEGLQGLRCSSYFHKRAKNDISNNVQCTSPSASIRSNLTSNFPRVLFLSWGQLCFRVGDMAPIWKVSEGRSACHVCQGW